MGKYSLPRLLTIIALSIVFTFSAKAVEIPDGVDSNCVLGLFGANKYVQLHRAIAQTWVENIPGEEQDLVGVVLDIDNPDDGDKPEEISVSFTVFGPDMKKQYSPALGGAFSGSGGVVLRWNLLDENEKPLKDGQYNILLSVSGKHYGDLLKNAIFPLYLVSAAPTVAGQRISAKEAAIEFGGAPTLHYTSTGYGIAAVVDYNESGEEIHRWEGPTGPGAHKLQSDLLDKDGNALPPGKYTTRIVVINILGESETLEFDYALAEPPPLELDVRMDVQSPVKVSDEAPLAFSVTINQNAALLVEHIADDGTSQHISKGAKDNPAVPHAKGTHEIKWNGKRTDGAAPVAAATHRIRVTATSLTGEKKIVETPGFAMAPATQGRTAKNRERVQKQKQAEVKRAVPNVTLKTSHDRLRPGGRMQTKITYRSDQDCMVRMGLYDKNGVLVKTLVDSGSKRVDKGSHSHLLDMKGLNDGKYRIVLQAHNNHGSRTTATAIDVVTR